MFEAATEKRKPLSVFPTAGSGDEDLEDLSGHIAFQAAHDLALGKAFGAAPFHIGLGALVGAHPAQHDHVKCGIRLAVSSPI